MALSRRPAGVLLWVALAVAAAALPGAAAARPGVGAHRSLLQAPAGYQFFLGNDTQGLDVKQMPGATVAQLAAACDAEPACNGFNSWGWLKYGIKNRTYWSDVSATRGAGAGLYVKNGLEPGSLHPQIVPGYTFTSKKDSSGGDIKSFTGVGNTPAYLASLCDTDPTCQGFNAGGWLKSMIRPSQCWYDDSWSQNPNEGIYVKDGAVLKVADPTPVSGYTLNYLKDSVGGDIRQATNFKNVSDLGRICDAEPGCIAFTSGGWLKSTLKPQSQWSTWSYTCDSNAGLYVKSAPSPAATPSPAPAASPVAAPAPTASPAPAASPAVTPAAVAPKIPEKMGTWIPFYTWPSNTFDDLINSVEGNDCIRGSFKAAVLIGPNSGPPNPANDTLHRNYFARIAAKNEWTTFGYLHVGYGKRPLAEVLAQVDTWLTRGADGLGDIIQGIWVNQVAPEFDQAGEAYMNAIIDRIQYYGGLVALNPGRSMDCKMAAKASFVNYFEGTYDTWQKTKPVCACSDVTRCIASIHGYTGDATADALASVMAGARASGFEATFITDRTMPNHYDGLPTLWKAELDGLCKTTINA